MFLSRNVRVAINFAGMLFVARKQHMLLLDTLKITFLSFHAVD